MAGDDKKEIGLEIGHVLFVDIVGYSKLLITEQSERLQKLKEIVWATEQFPQAQADEWLDKAIAYQDPGLSDIVSENLFDKIHSDPRWLPFPRKIGKAPDQLAKIEFKVPPLAKDH